MRFEDKEIFFIPRGDQKKTLQTINAVAEHEKDHPFIISSIEKYGLTNSKASIRRLFEALHRIILFTPDPKDEQWVRTVNRTLKDLRGNCVDYVTILSAFLRKMKVPHRIRMAEYENQPVPGLSHIYVQLLNGITLDPVIGQDQEGREHLKKFRRPYFNLERPYLRKSDKIIRA